MVKYKNSTLLTEISLFEYLKNSKILYVGFTQNQTITISGLKNLFEVKSEFIFDPWVCLRTLLTCVQESFLSQLTGKQLAHPWNITGLFLQRNCVWAVVPGQETVHLAQGGGILHPLNGLPVGYNKHVRSFDHVI